jgi:ubiquinone/menaquinone biosynthesis C-methylase UbiE
MRAMREPRSETYLASMRNDSAALAANGGSGVWPKVFSIVYDPILSMGEWAGMRRRRQELLARACGRTLELGSGTGLNLAHYPDDLDELILTEPDAAMRRRLEKRVRRSGLSARVLAAPAELLPLEENSIDTVVSTLVLCTVDAPDLALRELIRVLRPGGQLLFIEHVRAKSARLARWQDRLAEPWRRFAVGCRCNRSTVELMQACGLQLEVREASWSGAPPIVRPLMVGRAMTEAVQHLEASHSTPRASANERVR